jgi:hypothetical protein
MIERSMELLLERLLAIACIVMPPGRRGGIA